jgi:hypothetical protein
MMKNQVEHSTDILNELGMLLSFSDFLVLRREQFVQMNCKRSDVREMCVVCCVLCVVCCVIYNTESQSRTLHNVLNEHNAIDQTLKLSNNWITKLFRQETTDKLLIGAALTLFVCVCLYIIKVRLRIGFV